MSRHGDGGLDVASGMAQSSVHGRVNDIGSKHGKASMAKPESHEEFFGPNKTCDCGPNPRKGPRRKIGKGGIITWSRCRYALT